MYRQQKGDKYYRDVMNFCRTHRYGISIHMMDKNRVGLYHRIWLLYYAGLLETWDIIFKK